MDRLDTDDCGNFSCFYFDVDIKNQWVWISEKTPQNYVETLKEEFDREINGSSFFSVA